MVMDAAAPAATELKLDNLLDAGVPTAVVVARAAGRVTSLSRSSSGQPASLAAASTLLALLAGRLQTFIFVAQDACDLQGLSVLACCRELRSLSVVTPDSATPGKQDCREGVWGGGRRSPNAQAACWALNHAWCMVKPGLYPSDCAQQAAAPGRPLPTWRGYQPWRC